MLQQNRVKQNGVRFNNKNLTVFYTTKKPVAPIDQDPKLLTIQNNEPKLDASPITVAWED
jgi:hypothetical protein